MTEKTSGFQKLGFYQNSGIPHAAAANKKPHGRSGAMTSRDPSKRGLCCWTLDFGKSHRRLAVVHGAGKAVLASGLGL